MRSLSVEEASITEWGDDKRRVLVGFSRGILRDLERTNFEERDHDKAVAREIRRLEKLRRRQKSPAVYKAQRQRAAAQEKNRKARSERARERRAKEKAKCLAIQKKSREKHRDKRNAESLAYYHAHRDERLTYMREYSKRRPSRKKGS